MAEPIRIEYKLMIYQKNKCEFTFFKCDLCERETSIPSLLFSKKKAHYCSKECTKEATFLSKALKTTNCESCDKEFKTKNSLFCSKKCYGNSMRKPYYLHSFKKELRFVSESIDSVLEFLESEGVYCSRSAVKASLNNNVIGSVFGFYISSYNRFSIQVSDISLEQIQAELIINKIDKYECTGNSRNLPTNDRFCGECNVEEYFKS